jgi:putative FmdB family regulatory protein
MPVYAYECRDCGVRFERRQGFDDPPITVCPECEGEVHRLIQPAGIIFKGSGFYINDSRKSSEGSLPAGKKNETKTESKANSSSESSSKD